MYSKRVLITGIDGFTGKHLEESLKRDGFEVFGIVLKNSKNKNHFVCDIRDFESLKKIIDKIKPNYVFHLAGISFVGETDLKKIFEVNLFGSVNLLDSLKGSKDIKKILLSSSANIYGNQEKEILDESLCPNPQNPYANSKNAMENAAKSYFEDLNIIITRPFNYIGKYQNENFVIPKIVKHFKEKREVIELGDIDVKREFNDVRFVIECYKRLMFSNVKNQIVNVCTGKAVSLREVLKVFEEIFGYEIKVVKNEKFIRKNEIKVLKGSFKKLFSLIEKPKIYSLKETLREIIEA